MAGKEEKNTDVSGTGDRILPGPEGAAGQSLIRSILPYMAWVIVSGLVHTITDSFRLCQEAGGDTIRTGIVSMIVIPLFWYMLRKWDPEVCLAGRRVSKKGRSLRFLLLPAAFCGMALSLCYGWLTSALRLTEYFSNQIQDDLLSASSGVQIVVLGFLSPAAEELMCRGLMFGNLRKALPEIWAAVITSGFFALIHGNAIQAFYAFPMALLMQYLYHLEGGLEAPLAFHISANLTAVFLENIIR